MTLLFHDRLLSQKFNTLKISKENLGLKSTSPSTLRTFKQEFVRLHLYKMKSQRKRFEDSRLSLAYSDLEEMPHDVISKYGSKVKELDLSHNKISDLRFLSDLPNLQSLVLDDNHVTSQVKMPVCKELHTLWVNDNRIQNLAFFLNTIAKSCPNLQILSMMNNEAAPSYFNGGTYEQYLDYRYFVIGCLPNLKVLDYSPVSEEETKVAKDIYPSSRLSFLPRRRSLKKALTRKRK